MDPWLVALVLLVGLWAGLRLARGLRRWAARRRVRVGARGEAVALQLLEKHGFTILDTQPPALATVYVDGDPVEFEVRADALVQKAKTRYVAEFKTGRAAAIGNRSTRRQLLEYACTYDADALLLVDATTRTITRIEFPLPR